MGVGIVLGAGGPIGWAFHLGVLEGVRASGWDPADADRIVGTSAGAAIAATMLAGASTESVLESIAEPPTKDERAAMKAAVDEARSRRLRVLRPVAPGMVRHWRPRGGLAPFVGLLPSGVFPTFSLRRFPGVDGFDGWPDPLWIPTVRLDDAAVTVFGRDRRDVVVADAVEASQAVPGMFQPKHIDGDRYVDGAVASATHAELVAGRGCDVAVVSSVMSRPGRRPIRVRARRQLRREVAMLRRAGIRTLVLEPDDRVMRIAGGYPRTNGEAGREIVDVVSDMTVDALDGRSTTTSPESMG